MTNNLTLSGAIGYLRTNVTGTAIELVLTAERNATNLVWLGDSVLNNWDLESIPHPRKVDLEGFVQQGGGLLVIGGERNMYAENKQVEDALDRAMPAKLAPPRSPEGTCVVLIVDKSSSMEGKKMELARLAAIGVIDNLRPIDLVGVLMFDNSFQWAVPIRKAEDRALIKRLIAGILVVPVVGRAPRSPRGCAASRSGRMVRARSGSRRASTGSSGSSRSATACRSGPITTTRGTGCRSTARLR